VYERLGFEQINEMRVDTGTAVLRDADVRAVNRDILVLRVVGVIEHLNN
jgi:hypothetical protein